MTIILISIIIIFICSIFYPEVRFLFFDQTFWVLFVIFMIAYAIGRFFIGDIADEISGVNKYKNDE